MRVAQITKATIDRYVARRKAEGDASRTVNRETGLLGWTFALAKREGTLAFTPAITHLDEAGNAQTDGVFSAVGVEAAVPEEDPVYFGF